MFEPGLPDPKVASCSRQVAESLKLVPLPWLIRDVSRGYLSYDDYWQLSPSERAEMDRSLRQMPSEWASQPADPRLPLYEAQQPPLYYWIAAPLLRLVDRAGLPTQIWVLRLFGAFLASFAIPLVFLAARRAFSSDSLALGVAAVVASIPQLMLTVYRVGNESLSITMGSLVVFLGLWLADSPTKVRRAAVFGLALGGALLTKAYFLALLPMVPVLFVEAWPKHRKQRLAAARSLLAACAVCVVVCGWWYLRTLQATGTITGEQTHVAAQGATAAGLVRAVAVIDWRRVLDVLAISHIWLGNWSFLVARSWMYRIIEAIYVAGFLGMCLQIVRPRQALAKPSRIVLLATPYFALFAAHCYHAAIAYQSTGRAASLAHYLYGLVVVEAVILVVGLGRLLPARWALIPAPFLVAVFLALEMFGTWILLLPYYSGLIRHGAGGSLPAFPITQYAGGAVGSLLQGILPNKPAFLGMHSVALLAIGFLLSSFALFAIAAFLLTTARPADRPDAGRNP